MRTEFSHYDPEKEMGRAARLGLGATVVGPVDVVVPLARAAFDALASKSEEIEAAKGERLTYGQITMAAMNVTWALLQAIRDEMETDDPGGFKEFAQSLVLTFGMNVAEIAGLRVERSEP